MATATAQAKAEREGGEKDVRVRWFRHRIPHSANLAQMEEEGDPAAAAPALPGRLAEEDGAVIFLASSVSLKAWPPQEVLPPHVQVCFVPRLSMRCQPPQLTTQPALTAHPLRSAPTCRQTT